MPCDDKKEESLEEKYSCAITSKNFDFHTELSFNLIDKSGENGQSLYRSFIKKPKCIGRIHQKK